MGQEGLSAQVDTAPTFAGDEFEEQGQGQEEVKEEEDEEEEDKEDNAGSDCPVIPVCLCFSPFFRC